MTVDKNKKQTMRYSDAELSLMKNTFAENDELLNAIRKAMLQMPLDPIDLSLLEGIKGNRELQAVIRKSFLPELDPNAPRHQLIDLWMTIKLEDKSPEQAYPHLVAREGLIKFIDQQLQLLAGKEVGEKIVLNDALSISGKSPEDFYAGLVMRNTMIAHTEMQLQQFTLLAGRKDETVEQTMKQLEQTRAKDSTK